MAKPESKKGAHALVDSTRTPTPTAAPVSSPGRQQRVYKSTQEVDHDLFRLKVATMMKNGSYSEDNPMIEHHEHTHWYHTVDSSGRAQATSMAVGGHHHAVEIMKDANGEMLLNEKGEPMAKVSEPRRWVKIRKGKKVTRSEVPVFVGVGPDAKLDTHVHQIEYTGSERITLRTPSIEFAKMDSALRAAREPVIPGVTG